MQYRAPYKYSLPLQSILTQPFFSDRIERKHNEAWEINKRKLNREYTRFQHVQTWSHVPRIIQC